MKNEEPAQHNLEVQSGRLIVSYDDRVSDPDEAGIVLLMMPHLVGGPDYRAAVRLDAEETARLRAVMVADTDGVRSQAEDLVFADERGGRLRVFPGILREPLKESMLVSYQRPRKAPVNMPLSRRDVFEIIDAIDDLLPDLTASPSPR